MKTCISLYLISLLISGAAYASPLSCEVVVHNLNQSKNDGRDIIRDQRALVQLLRHLNKNDTLPQEFITRRQAIKMGWSGNPEDSLWTVWSLNKKKIGGDVWENNTTPEPGRWYTADIDSEHGFRSNYHLLFSPDYLHRYIITDSGLIKANIENCL